MANLGYAPSITEDDFSALIECVVSSKCTNLMEYQLIFLTDKRPWTDKMNLYVGPLNKRGESSLPSVSASSIPDGELSVTAGPVSPSIELIGKVDKKSLSYTVRYLRKPRPIILDDLDDGLSIQGISVKSECELDESLHPEIL